MFRPDLAAWAPWHPQLLAKRLAGIDVPWYVAAGWALDRFNEVASRFPDCEFFAVGDGHAAPYASTPPHFHQTWARERATGIWRFDVFREPGEDDTWTCRRDAAIRMPYDRLIARTADGIPHCQPEVALLFKAKNPRDKDEADFARVLPSLDLGRRGWLREALIKVHPGHHWLDAL